MRRGTLGESDTEVDDNVTYNFNYNTRSTKINPHKQPTTGAAGGTAEKNSLARNVKGAARRKMTARSRHIKQLREIRKLQSSTKLLIPRLSFGRLVREISLEINPHIVRYTFTALEGLQEATEAFLTQILQDAYLLTMHRKCITLSKADMLLLRALKINL